MSELLKLERELEKALVKKNFLFPSVDVEILKIYKELAESYTMIDNNIVVLSDYISNKSHIFNGGFGGNFGLQTGETEIPSVFERELFDKVHPEDLLERHALELSYYHLQKQIDPNERPNYISHCNIRIKNLRGKYLTVNHRIHYIKSFGDAEIWLSICVYSPSTDTIPGNGINGRILNSITGEITPIRNFVQVRKHILTKREIQILKHLGKGCSSKEISSELHLSTNTIYRHRQNIIEKLNVHNSSEAVQVGIILGLLK